MGLVRFAPSFYLAGGGMTNPAWAFRLGWKNKIWQKPAPPIHPPFWVWSAPVPPSSAQKSPLLTSVPRSHILLVLLLHPPPVDILDAALMGWCRPPRRPCFHLGIQACIKLYSTFETASASPGTAALGYFRFGSCYWSESSVFFMA